MKVFRIKQLFATAAFLFCTAVLSASGGLMAGAGKLKHIQTEHFDIIYPEECRNAGRKLAAECENVLKDIADEYGYKMLYRIPVVITPETDVFNAYYSNYVRNHIVLYYTVPDEDFINFSENFISTFRHELNHFVTLNFHKEWKQKFLHFAGDIYNINYYLEPSQFITEGSSVAEESRYGEGRLNNGFYLHMVRQAKLSGIFPDYTQVAGGRNRFPGGSAAYGFGGPFTEWLQKTYGMESYARFWYHLSQKLHLTYELAFKAAYGKSLPEVWKEFEDSVWVPQIPSNPLQVSGIKAFLPDAKNGRGSRYESFTSSEKGFCFMDDASGGVYFCSKEKDGYSAPVKLFTSNYGQRISLSQDGRYLALYSYSFASANLKNEVSVYDLEKKAAGKITVKGVRDGTVFKKYGKYYLAAVSTELGNPELCIYALEKKPVKIISINTDGAVPLSLSSTGDGIACIWVKGLDFSVRKFRFNESAAECILDYEEYNMPRSKMSLRNLNVNYSGEQEILSFSYSEKNTFPRLGYVSLKEGKAELVLEENDLSGGVYETVTDGRTLVYSGCFFDQYKMLECDLSKMPLSVTEIIPEKRFFYAESEVGQNDLKLKVFTLEERTELPAGGEENLIPEDGNNHSPEEKDYRKFYGGNGAFIPLGLTEIKGPVSSEVSPLFAGLSYMMRTPWDSDTVTFSLGYLPVLNDWGGSVAFSGEDGAGTFLYDEKVSLIFKENRFLQTHNELGLSFTKPFGNVSKFSLQERNDFFFGELQSIALEWGGTPGKILSAVYGIQDEKTDYRQSRVRDVNLFGAVYSSVHYTGPGLYEKFGIILQAVLQNYYEYNLVSGTSFSYTNAFPKVELFIPKLIPVDCRKGFTWNMPVILSGSLVPDTATLVSGNADVLLFAMDIENGLHYVPVYFNSFSLEASYTFLVSNKNASWEISRIINDFSGIEPKDITDFVELSAVMKLKLNTGTLNRGDYPSVRFFVRSYIRNPYYMESGYKPLSSALFSVSFSSAF